MTAFDDIFVIPLFLPVVCNSEERRGSDEILGMIFISWRSPSLGKNKPKVGFPEARRLGL
jgi:hypothetical protein